ncbi:SMI1/KNR4 family protein [Pedosphaera parvula]|uniref:Knr4/Smi1-like domain-containing protein n=1 Tax=Pedosphaera parvula (strain Ellin514) TaxID=320771 RepID=B9XA24_PEDPL|nr:SMI1/KNR4 family protein [Pedosphaera parvula]EEF63365.1 hypothetical protein Cflav_PD6000 [Pedosphaera parvula Ellin514]
MDYLARLKELECFPAKSRVAIADDDIEALERDIGARLPDGYREFLQIGGGYVGTLSCPCKEPSPFGTHILSGFDTASEISGVLDSMITPRNMITIASGDFGQFTCLSFAGIDRGCVYALDSEFRCYWQDEEFHQRFKAMANGIREYLRLRGGGELVQKPAGYDSLYLLAESFDEFLELCSSD